MNDPDPGRQSEAPQEADKADLPSCEGCRKRKLKCSRQLPECSNCERLETQCFYDGNKKSKPGLRSGAVESLSRRLGAVEAYLFAGGQSQSLANDESLGNTDSRSQPPPPRSPIPAARPPSSAIAETSQPVLDVLSKLTQEIHRLGSAITSVAPAAGTQTAMQDASPSHHDSTCDQGEEGRVSKRRRTGDGSHAPHLRAPQWENESERGDGTGPFDDRRVRELLQEFFERIQPWLPILHHTRFPERVADISQRPQILIILHAINVAALRFVTDEEGVPLPADYVTRQVKRSRDHVLLTAMSGLSIENLQALTIVAFSDIGNGESEKAWALIGSLTRSVDYLRLTVEPEDNKDHGGLLRPQVLPAPKDFIEEEEQRRLFWNVFNLDRFCSSTTGRNTSLTAADVSRRLPVCGGVWYSGTRSPTPYFGIWTSSSAKIGNSITYLPEHFASPADSGAPTDPSTGPHDPPSERAQPRPTAAAPGTTDMSNVGAFAYYIESSESFSRVIAYFLRQRVDFSDRHQLTAWLMRFKELDLRLVHWKLSLPREWQDSGMSREIMPGVMDPNMTNAHVTHNASMILLHHRIAYPSPELRTTKLPSLYSAETCQSAAVETANITRSYIEKWPPNTLVAPQMAFASFVSARLLLAHWKFTKSELAPEFWVLVECLEEMHRRWHGHAANKPIPDSVTSLFKQLALRLRMLQERCLRESGLIIDVSGQFEDTSWEQTADTPSAEHQSIVPQPFGISPGIDWPGYASQNTPGLGIPPDELSAISQVLTDQQYMDMDRVISFEDVMYTGHRDVVGGGTDAWDGAQQAAGTAMGGTQDALWQSR
ncbi:hypothetical protein F5X68DRAFT_254373 [Plectosphaerella plurivora]|uniref:Zn(2)-C6 fungal-type domain-containing protein n=1 Tax=Plectosphaerella plurivora TaxID=936078 RepID=A0A9P8VGV6_9PEZI|nr:hypothetical protein F5X68DRAFT_254373 [Plectosphaerella plurivora]